MILLNIQFVYVNTKNKACAQREMWSDKNGTLDSNKYLMTWDLG